ncbi:hypothetical protein L211DRAFT_824569 [Terfezia boudieri ATCC MYA-4762]|uniref:Uncharacterized protein n=1 Tax=Terfezia boudieri ATCC MYA-4762 TaxID=1051890 RepID=A0A3N4LS65_9PEZI|nr:hypothetical protein L211DRAFT_824569 [Terfezia boudieri ATCC MYA-4762]
MSGFNIARGYIDASTGQRGAFPGLEEYGDEFFCGPANDGMDYLRMVRSEARGVPSLLIAKAPPMPSIPENDASDEEIEDGEIFTGIGGGQDASQHNVEAEDYYGEDTRGWYEDGTYIATGTASFPQRPPSPQKVALLTWHCSLMSTFRQKRKLLHESSPPPNLSSATEGNIVSITRPLPQKQDDWIDLIYNTSPTPSFLWKMDQYTVLKAFKVMTDLLKVGTDTTVEQTLWIYGLLLRCSEVMTPDEVYIVRELGKKAIQVQKKLEMSNCLSGNKKAASVLAIAPEPEVLDTNIEQEAIEDSGISAANRELERDAPRQKENDAGGSSTGIGGSLSSPALTLHSSTGDKTPSEVFVVEQPSSLESSSALEVSPTAPDPKAIATQRLHKKRKNRKPKNGIYDYIPSANTLGTLDMIISIVGDFFGQRDLLGERRYHSLGASWNKA